MAWNFASFMRSAKENWPGVLVCGLIALAASFLSDHYGAPSMLMALLLGLPLHFLYEDSARMRAGVDFSAKFVLRIGVAFLGARISFDLISMLGLAVPLLLFIGLLITIASGFLGARLLGRGWRLAILTSGAVAICGASAALAISAILPRNEFSERNLGFTVFGVTLLSTIAMVIYPIIGNALGFDDLQMGVFLGGTIHDVAQVVGAGFSVSDMVGETSTTVKLIRVSFLAPVVLVLSLAIRHLDLGDGQGGQKPPLLPGFVIGFLLLAILNSFGVIPGVVQNTLWMISKWALLAAVAAVGVKTEFRKIMDVPAQSFVLIIGETLVLAGFVGWLAYSWLG